MNESMTPSEGTGELRELTELEPESLDASGLRNAAQPLVGRSFSIFMELAINLLHVGNYALLTQLFAVAALKDEVAGPRVLDLYAKVLRKSPDPEQHTEGFGTPEEAKRKIREYGPMFRDQFRRFHFSANADHFEIYVSSVLTTLNYLFPRVLIDKEVLDKGSVPGRLLLEGGSILDARLRFIESRVMAQVFGESLPGVIKKLSSKLKSPFPFEKDAERQLTEISATRNLLTHNRGLANSAYLNRLRRAGIACVLRIGESIPITDTSVDAAAQFLRGLAISIHDGVMGNLPEMSHHEVALRQV